MKSLWITIRMINVSSLFEFMFHIFNTFSKNLVPGNSATLETLLGDNSFDSLKGKVSNATLKAIESMGFSKMTEIQAKSIPSLLEGRDLVGSAKTGSGKTLGKNWIKFLEIPLINSQSHF